MKGSDLGGWAGTTAARGALSAAIGLALVAGCRDSSPKPDATPGPDAGSDAGTSWSPSSCDAGAFGRGTWQVRCSGGATSCDVRADHDVSACVPLDAGAEPPVSCTIYPPSSPTDTTALTFDLRDDGNVLRVWARFLPDGSFEACQVSVAVGDSFWVDSTDPEGTCGPLQSDRRCRVDIERVELDAERPGFRGSAICRGLDATPTFGLDVTAPDGGPVEFFVDGCKTVR